MNIYIYDFQCSIFGGLGVEPPLIINNNNKSGFQAPFCESPQGSFTWSIIEIILK